MRGREKFEKYYKIILILYYMVNYLPKAIRKKILVWFRNTTGNKGLVLRYVLLKSLAKSMGKNVSVHPSVFLFHVENLTIGNNVSLHPMCYIDAAGEIFIGNDVSIANGCTIMSSTHNYEDLNIPIKDQKETLKKVIIYDNVWIGARATILAGINIKSGAIVGANSVVTKETNENEIVAGCPAKVIKNRQG